MTPEERAEKICEAADKGLFTARNLRTVIAAEIREAVKEAEREMAFEHIAHIESMHADKV
jgi:hypothetical protein